MTSGTLRRVACAGLVTGVVDFLWACGQTVFMYHGTITRLWQGVAAAVLGPSAMNGGTATFVLGICMHFCVATTWSAVFLFLATRFATIGRTIRTWPGVIKVAAIYGPFVWAFMSLIVIPILYHRPPAITQRWLVQLIGHIPFVGTPIVASIAGRGPCARFAVR